MTSSTCAAPRTQKTRTLYVTLFIQIIMAILARLGALLLLCSAAFSAVEPASKISFADKLTLEGTAPDLK